MKSSITKKAISEHLGNKSDWHMFGWTMNQCGAYELDGEIKLYKAFRGQGLDANVYGGIATVSLTELVQDWLDGQRTKADTINRIADAINA